MVVKSFARLRLAATCPVTLRSTTSCGPVDFEEFGAPTGRIQSVQVGPTVQRALRLTGFIRVLSTDQG